MAVRQPAVAGSFYPSDPTQLRKFFAKNLTLSTLLQSAKAVIVPHAGYIYSGLTACRVLSRVKIPKKILLIGPNHRGIGSSFAVQAQGIWKTPLGDVRIAQDLAQGLLKACPAIREDALAHCEEHSLEVEIPILQARNPDIEIVPLIVGTMDLDQAREVAHACGQFLSKYPHEFLMVVSTDLNHYKNDSETRVKDRYVLQAIEKLDSRLLAQEVGQHKISMCGFVPVYMLLEMKSFLPLESAELVDYRTSAETSGDYDRVVGYAGFILK